MPMQQPLLATTRCKCSSSVRKTRSTNWAICTDPLIGRFSRVRKDFEETARAITCVHGCVGSDRKAHSWANDTVTHYKVSRCKFRNGIGIGCCEITRIIRFISSSARSIPFQGSKLCSDNYLPLCRFFYLACRALWYYSSFILINFAWYAIKKRSFFASLELKTVAE